jgi:CMP/dCMP kinase
MIITLGGQLGAGKSTAGKILAARLGYEYFYTGQVWRDAAAQEGLTLAECFAKYNNDPTFDHRVDAAQIEFAKRGNTVFDGRMAFFVLRQYNPLKIYFTVDPLEGAKRIYEAARAKEQYKSVQDALAQTSARMTTEIAHYQGHYGVNIHDVTNYDLIIDTTQLSAEQAASHIQQHIAKNL